MVQWLQLLVTGIAMGAIYSLVALGFVLIYNASGVVNMAQGSFVMLGTFICYFFLHEVLLLPFWLASIVSVVAVMVIAAGSYVLVVKPVMRLSHVGVIMGTVGLSILFENLVLLKWRAYPVHLPAFTGEKMLRVGGLNIAPQSLWIIGVMVTLFLMLWLFLKYTRLGKQMTAASSNPSAATLAGVHVGRMVNLAFMVSAAIGAIGGITMANVIPVSYESGGALMFTGFVAGILGGWGSAAGAVVGGLAVGIIASFASGLLPIGYQNAILFGLLVLVLYIRPQGLMGGVIGGHD